VFVQLLPEDYMPPQPGDVGVGFCNSYSAGLNMLENITCITITTHVKETCIQLNL
jgi:hypothetical protein